jgi:hypothetical protein
MAVTMKNVIFWDIKAGSPLRRETFCLLYRAQPDNAM